MSSKVYEKEWMKIRNDNEKYLEIFQSGMAEKALLRNNLIAFEQYKFYP